ncbi:alpha/beta fold hydrolase [Facklamia sp. DSM 111018]|uniref:Alpha/beta fold hydrolase n=1 Tax=Facklamia lactis TaxID=2749967 RepID=A0ABS0LRJ4_9LACT|nr:alpha/beta fold hydrolase [Facklamia lactis]MBG9981018.1 alpha/beta fold hydrolase [Facklamia lactis]MBG9986619.1 alpha/beta fold hydrolase [Facklamia lactis]
MAKRRLFYTALGGIASYQLARMMKKYSHPLRTINHQERLLDDVSIEHRINWIKEETFDQQWTEELWPYLSARKKTGSLITGSYQLKYDFYPVKDPKITVLVVHGYNEYKEKYAEVIYYLLQANIQVMVYDQRDHGQSKLSEKNTQINTGDFRDYVADLHLMVTEARHISETQTALWLLGHSMGGAIVSRFAQAYPGLIDGLVLSVPMFDIEMGNLPTPLIHLYVDFAKKLGYGHRYIPTTIDKKNDLAHLSYRSDNHLTNSKVRGEHFFKLNYQLHRYPTKLGSNNWLKAALDTLQVINQPINIAKMTMPTLLFRAGQDELVTPQGLANLAYYLPNSLNYVLPESKHEIFLSDDQQLQAVMRTIIYYIEQNSDQLFEK